jgi:hypothetical protein
LTYRGYELEQKPLMVGWQITITKNGSFIRNSSIVKELSIAMDEAHAYIDDRIARAGTTAA